MVIGALPGALGHASSLLQGDLSVSLGDGGIAVAEVIADGLGGLALLEQPSGAGVAERMRAGPRPRRPAFARYRFTRPITASVEDRGVNGGAIM